MKETIEEGDEIITTTKFSWEQKRMYSEKQMDDAYDKGFKDATERMYSEEDMISFANFKTSNLMKHSDLKGFYLGDEKVFNLWFERNKKK
jgi:hypothetical protein